MRCPEPPGPPATLKFQSISIVAEPCAGMGDGRLMLGFVMVGRCRASVGAAPPARPGAPPARPAGAARFAAVPLTTSFVITMPSVTSEGIHDDARYECG